MVCLFRWAYVFAFGDELNKASAQRFDIPSEGVFLCVLNSTERGFQRRKGAERIWRVPAEAGHTTPMI